MELLPITPPIVARLLEDGSGPNIRPFALSWRLSRSRMIPGSTVTVPGLEVRGRGSDCSTSRSRSRALRRPSGRPATTRRRAAGSGCRGWRRARPRAMDVVGRLRDDDADRLDLVVGGVGRVEHPRGAIETHFAADARVQLGFEHAGGLDRRPAGLRFGVDPPIRSGGSGSLVSTLAGSGTTGMERRLPLRSAAKRSVDSLAGSLGEQTSKGG